MCSTPISFFYISGHSCSELIRVRLCLSLKEAKAREGALERFIRFFGALQWYFLLTIKCGGAFQHAPHGLLFLSYFFFGPPFVCLFRLSFSFTQWTLSICGGVLWGREYDVISYANIVLILITRPGATPPVHSKHNINDLDLPVSVR